MRGLGFGAGLGTGALLVPGVAGLIGGLGGIRPGKEDPDEDPDQDPGQEEDGSLLGTDGSNLNPNATFYADPTENVEEQPSNQVEDVVVVGEEEEEEEEEAPASEETTEPVMSREEAERQAAQVEGVRDRKYHGTTLPASLGFPAAYYRFEGRPVTEGEFEDFDPTRDLQLGGSEYSEGGDERFRLAMRAPQTDYTGGFDFLPADDPMRSLAPLLPQQIDRGASEMGGTPRSQARSQVQQAANEAARLRMEDAAARGQEYNKALNQVLDNAALVGENPLLGDPGILRALRGFGRRGGRRSSSFAEGGRIDKSNDLVARIKRKYGLR